MAVPSVPSARRMRVVGVGVAGGEAGNAGLVPVHHLIQQAHGAGMRNKAQNTLAPDTAHAGSPGRTVTRRRQIIEIVQGDLRRLAARQRSEQSEAPRGRDRSLQRVQRGGKGRCGGAAAPGSVSARSRLAAVAPVSGRAPAPRRRPRKSAGSRQAAPDRARHRRSAPPPRPRPSPGRRLRAARQRSCRHARTGWSTPPSAAGGDAPIAGGDIMHRVMEPRGRKLPFRPRQGFQNAVDRLAIARRRR